MSLQLRVDGINETVRAFQELPKRMRNKHLTIALSAGAGIIKNAAVAIVRRDSGLLAKSIGVKVPSVAKTIAANKPLSAVIGARRRFVGPAIFKGGATKILTAHKALKRVLSGGSVQIRKPSRYAHLVEGGHGGPHPAAPHPFLAPAVASSGSAASSRMLSKLKAGLEQEAQNIFAGFK